MKRTQKSNASSFCRFSVLCYAHSPGERGSAYERAGSDFGRFSPFTVAQPLPIFTGFTGSVHRISRCLNITPSPEKSSFFNDSRRAILNASELLRKSVEKMDTQLVCGYLKNRNWQFFCVSANPVAPLVTVQPPAVAVPTPAVATVHSPAGVIVCNPVGAAPVANVIPGTVTPVVPATYAGQQLFVSQPDPMTPAVVAPYGRAGRVVYHGF